jgi:predicted alpha/beta-fold hydrolase
MPLPSYSRPWYLSNGHFETIWPSLFRKVESPLYRRERMTTSDGDFLDLDWLQSGHKRLAVISHGLEGDSRRHYVAGMANALAADGWDVLAWNFRGCGGEINRRPRFTHNGATDDLDDVVRHALKKYNYSTISLVGFSMGGNLTLVYLGRDSDRVPVEVKAAVCFSVPCDLAAASMRLAESGNLVYMRRFIRLMGQKIRLQAKRFPNQFPCAGYRKIKTFHDFDGRYTAPLHGFRDAQHYWEECSSKRYLDAVRIPAWIINARNDPFLTPDCFPDSNHHGNLCVKLGAPDHGGHCGFTPIGKHPQYWSETVAISLLSAFPSRQATVLEPS